MAARAGRVGFHRVGHDLGVGEVDTDVELDIAGGKIVAQERSRYRVRASAVGVGARAAMAMIKPRVGEDSRVFSTILPAGFDPLALAGVGQSPYRRDVVIRERVIGGHDLTVGTIVRDHVHDEA